VTHHFRHPIAVFAFLIGAYFLVLSPALLWPSYLDSPVGVLVVLPYLSVYLFHVSGNSPASLPIPKPQRDQIARGYPRSAASTASV